MKRFARSLALIAVVAALVSLADPSSRPTVGRMAVFGVAVAAAAALTSRLAGAGTRDAASPFEPMADDPPVPAVPTELAELSSSLRDIASERLLVRPLGDFPVIYLEPVRNYGWRAFAKRTFDILFAGGLLVLLAPVIMIVALAVKFGSHGPVFFSQQRVGRGGKIFTIHKFRSMVVGAESQLDDLQSYNEADGPLFKMRDDPRVTRVGRVLRRTSLDELPQLVNVVRGEMSMVGPRPALPSEAAQWEPKLRQRLRVRPGLTGMWQVHGRSDASFNSYGRLDLYYVDNWSLIADLGIIARTGPCLLRRDGAC